MPGATVWGWFILGCVPPDTGFSAGSRDPDAPAAVPTDDEVEVLDPNHVPRDDTSWWDETHVMPAPGPDYPDALTEAAISAFFAEGTLYDFHINLSPSSRGDLTKNPREWVPATFSADGHSWPVMVALKGTTSFRDLSGKAAFKVNFVATDPAQRFHGLKRLTLNAMVQDSSMMHEHVAYWLYRHRGVPAPRHTYARVSVDGTNYGLHGVVETMDEQFLKAVRPKDNNGNLYEGNVSDFIEGKTKHFEIEEEDGLYTPYADIDEEIATLQATPAEGYMALLDRDFDLDELMRMWAIDIVTTNVDGYAWFANNYMAYHGEKAWHIWPWGHDQCLHWFRDVTDYSKLEGELVKRCANTPDCRERLEAEMLDLVTDWEQGELEAMTVATANLIQADCDADPRREFPCETDDAVRFVRERPATVREVLE